MSAVTYQSAHEPIPYGQQWKQDFTVEGIKKSFAPVIPSVADLKQQGIVCWKVFGTGLFTAGKFICSKHQ